MLGEHLRHFLIFSILLVFVSFVPIFILKQPDLTDQRAIDNIMIALDGTENKGIIHILPYPGFLKKNFLFYVWELCGSLTLNQLFKWLFKKLKKKMFFFN